LISALNLFGKIDLSIICIATGCGELLAAPELGASKPFNNLPLTNEPAGTIICFGFFSSLSLTSSFFSSFIGSAIIVSVDVTGTVLIGLGSSTLGGSKLLKA
jgi:hypothetical protein